MRTGEGTLNTVLVAPFMKGPWKRGKGHLATQGGGRGKDGGPSRWLGGGGEGDVHAECMARRSGSCSWSTVFGPHHVKREPIYISPVTSV